jgi:hypothetical protein
MRQMRNMMVTAGLVLMALIPMAATPSDQPVPPHDQSSPVPVAIAQPLAAMDTGVLVAIPSRRSGARLPESGMLVLVGSALMGLAAIVRKTTHHF